MVVFVSARIGSYLRSEFGLAFSDFFILIIFKVQQTVREINSGYLRTGQSGISAVSVLGDADSAPNSLTCNFH